MDKPAPNAPFALAGGNPAWSPRDSVPHPTRANGRLTENLPAWVRRGQRLTNAQRLAEEAKALLAYEATFPAAVG